MKVWALEMVQDFPGTYARSEAPEFGPTPGGSGARLCNAAMKDCMAVMRGMHGVRHNCATIVRQAGIVQAAGLARDTQRELSHMDTIAHLEAEILKLKAKLAAKDNSPLKLKVSEKGAISIYGMGRFPVTLYRTQMERLLDQAEVIKQFIADNADRLAVKA